ncbi:hypothetical protein [Bradyrhizobium sp.]
MFRLPFYPMTVCDQVAKDARKKRV